MLGWSTDNRLARPVKIVNAVHAHAFQIGIIGSVSHKAPHDIAKTEIFTGPSEEIPQVDYYDEHLTASSQRGIRLSRSVLPRSLASVACVAGTGFDRQGVPQRRKQRTLCWKRSRCAPTAAGNEFEI